MKRFIYLFIILLVCCCCKTTQQENEQQEETAQTVTAVEAAEPIDEEAIIRDGLKEYLLSEEGLWIMTDDAKDDLFESEWPEVQCEREGYLLSPRECKNIRIVKNDEGCYHFECECPLDGDTIVDDYIIHASYDRKSQKVVITHIEMPTFTYE